MKAYLHAPELTDDVIEKAFEGTNFGRMDYREFLGYSVLKKACGWHCGHTITTIMIQMGLITPKNKSLTKLGRMFLSDCYDDPLRSAVPPAASAPEGWKLMPLKASPEILQAGIKAHYERQKHQQPEDVEFKGPMECAYDEMLSAAPAPGVDTE